MAVIGDFLYWIFVPGRLHEDVSGLHAGDVFDDFVFGFVGEQLDADGCFLPGEFHESVMAFVEQFADVETVSSVLPGSERVSDSGSELEFEDHVAAVCGDLYPSVSELGECHVSPEAFVVFFHWLSLFSYDLCGHSQYNM